MNIRALFIMIFSVALLNNCASTKRMHPDFKEIQPEIKKITILPIEFDI